MITQLAWDSEFFGLQIGSLEIDGRASLIDFKNEFTDYDLLYIFSPFPLLQEDVKMAYSGTRVELEINPVQCSIDIPQPSKSTVEVLDTLDENEKPALFSLARASGHCSRFKMDPVLKDDFEKLYGRWMQLILDRKDKVLVCREDGRFTGMLTLQKMGDQGKLDLMAVKEIWQRKGVGKALLHCLIGEACYQGLKNITVITQGENSAAIGLYKKMGFRLTKMKYVYHWHSPKIKNKKG